MTSNQLFHFHTITEYHRTAGLPKPAHPQISLVHMDDLNNPLAEGRFSLIYDFYSISMKRVKPFDLHNQRNQLQKLNG